MQTEQQQAISSNHRHPNLPSICQECTQNPWKYRCPCCSILTCSLPCVKSHKQRTNCTGKKDPFDKTISRSCFNDDFILSDYNFLEDTKRVTEAACRARSKNGSYNPSRLPKNLHNFRKAVRSRGLNFHVLPYGMMRRTKNRSFFCKRENAIYWMVEWRFHSTDVVLRDFGLNENMNLCSLIQKHLKPSPWIHLLKSFCNEDVNNLKFFIQKDLKGANSVFRKLNIGAPFKDQLSGLSMVEYPVIYVYLPSHDCNLNVEEIADNKFMAKPEAEAETKVEAEHSPNHQKGILFKEEEIMDDDDSSDTKVLDLKKTALEVDISPEKLSSLVGCFEFEQDLKALYSNVTGELNPDDYFCFDDFDSYN